MSEHTVERPASVEFFFDVMCPYAYQSSRWIREVRARTGLEVVWRFFSLEEINRVEGKKHPWERPWSYGFSQMRVGALLRRRSQADLDRWYAAVGQAFHIDAVKAFEPEVHRSLLDDLGYGASVLDEALDDPTTADEVRADHDHVVQRWGGFGVPTIVFPPLGDEPARAVYQQMVPAPLGDEAVAAFDLVVAFNRFPQMFELRHPKTGADIGLVAETFEPYLRARAWKTIENPAP